MCIRDSFTSPLKLVTEIENFPANLKGLADLFKDKKVARLKEWMIKMRLKDQIIVELQTNKLSWYNYIQLDSWTNEWLKTNGKCRECTKYEQFLSSHEEMQKDALRKGEVSRIYNLILEQEEKQTEIEGLKSIWEHDLNTEIKTEHWTKIWKVRVLRLMLVRIKEKNLKLV